MKYLSLFLLGCSEYDINEQTPDPPAGGDSGVAEEIPEEEPPDCSVELAEPVEGPLDKDCEVATVDVADPWNVAVEWQWQGLSTDSNIDQVMMLPAVGNLTDDDGDGVITESDVPDIIALAFDGADGWQAENVTGGSAPATLVLLEGSTGEEQWALEGFYWKGGPAIADVTGDGVPEVIAFDDRLNVVAAVSYTHLTLPTTYTV